MPYRGCAEFLQRAAGGGVVCGEEHFFIPVIPGRRKASNPESPPVISSPDSGFALTRAPE
jgi:hypothetical protein